MEEIIIAAAVLATIFVIAFNVLLGIGDDQDE